VKVGFHSPLPPAPTGVADYAAALLEELRARCDVKVNSPGGDVCLYHLGNNPLHREIYVQAVGRPGVAVLHDAVLHHFLLGLLGRADYIEEFVYNYGEWSRGLAAELWEERPRSPQDPRYFQYAMVRRVAEASRAVVVHNPGAARIVAAHAPSARIVEIPHLFRRPAPVSESAALRWRARHGIAPGTFLFGVFGHLRETKRLLPVLRAFGGLRAAGAHAALLVAGEFTSAHLAQAAQPLLCAPGVLRLGYLPEREFWLAAAAVDACINLRSPAAGETSGIAIRMMGIGKPVLVSAGEETARLPETACLRVPAGLAEERVLAEYMRWLGESRAAAREIGLRAAAHIAAHHSPAEASRRYWDLLCECSG
jgi:glycosyltransferase involved in cell wall biosynthesis